jgi:hypothetical protein
MTRLLLLALLALPLYAQGSSQCTLFPDITVHRDIQDSLCTPHMVMTNVSDVWANVTVRVFDARNGGHVDVDYEIAPHGKAKLNLTEGPDHADIIAGDGNRPPNEHWFVDAYMKVLATGGDVRVVLEQQRGGLPLREYGQRCEPSPR